MFTQINSVDIHYSAHDQERSGNVDTSGELSHRTQGRYVIYR